MACGVCPVATTVGCDGDALMGVGVPLDPLSLESDLRLAIRLLAETPEVARQLGRMARQRAVERYSLARNIDALIDIYSELVEGAPDRASSA
jgi:glycosyltransferase involved in cell wall biosynthesis